MLSSKLQTKFFITTDQLLLLCFLIFSDIDECFADYNPCKNEGTCVNLPGSYRCDCKSGYSGINCEIGEKMYLFTFHRSGIIKSEAVSTPSDVVYQIRQTRNVKTRKIAFSCFVLFFNWAICHLFYPCSYIKYLIQTPFT